MNPGPLILVAASSLSIAMITGRMAPRVWLVATVLAAVAALGAAGMVLTGGEAWEWRSEYTVGGELLHFRLDAVSALFLALLGVVGGAGTIYAREYWTDAAHPRSARSGRVWWSALLASMGWVLASSNGLHFLIAWEMFTLASYFLITLDRQKTGVRAAGWLYLAASHAATLGLFAFFGILAAQTGSWELGPMRERAELAPLFWLALGAFGIKAGVFPLHIWLPSAHASAPSHVSAIMSGVSIKLGIYGLVRFSGWLPVPSAAGGVVASLGVVSAVLGVAFALGQHDLKHLLAYHSVENIGIILIGFGFSLIAVQHDNAAWGQLALAGALLHVWNHGLFKSLLFLGAGAVLHATGTREMSRLGGLWRSLPWTTALFALGAAAISGLPPLNGFVSEWLVYLSLFDALQVPGSPALAAICATVLLGITSALALACFIKVCGVVFLGTPRSDVARHARECGLSMRGPMMVLALACIAIGLAPVLFWPAVVRAASVGNPTWSRLAAPPSLKVLGDFHLMLAVAAAVAAAALWQVTRQKGLRRALTWDCGYAVPSSRMQYTAGSFATIVTGWFAWILRPVRHEQRPTETFAAGASFEEHTPEVVLERVVVPSGNGVLHLAAAARRLQHGRAQSYILYLAGAIAALLLAAFMQVGP